MLEWQIGEAEDWDAFEPLEAIVETGAAPRRMAGQRLRLGRLLRGLLLVAVLVALAMGYRIWRDYRENIGRIRTDIQGTIDLEAWAWQSSNQELADDLIDNQASDGWARRFRRVQAWTRRWAGDEAQMPVMEIRNVELRGDLALVEAVATQPGVPWSTTPYRETRFYRKVEDRWRRTAPAADFWGPQRTLETAHFRFIFRQRDVEAVLAVVAEVEELYAALRRDAGLDTNTLRSCETDTNPSPEERSACEESPAAEELLTIEIVPRTDVMAWRFTGDRLMVPSPALFQVPVEQPNSVRLRQSIAYPLARRVLDEALQETQVQSAWRPMAVGLRLWLGWDDNPLPSAWRYHVEELLRQRLEQSQPLQLGDLATWGAEQWDRSDWWVRIMAAETVVEYVVATYSRERLPALVRGLAEHKTWDTLIPAVFGVPAADFEAGWQAHLATHYKRRSS